MKSNLPQTPPPSPAPPRGGGPLQPVVEALTAEGRARMSTVPQRDVRREFPSRVAIFDTIEALRSVLFPGYFGPSELSGESLRYHIGATLDRCLHGMQEQIKRGLCATCPEPDPVSCEQCEERSRVVAQSFIESLPRVRRLLASDVEAAYEGDPALSTPDEAIFCYPGLLAITNHRLAHELYLHKIPLLPRMISEQAHSATGIDIHPGARIGERFFIDHGTGVVIGETCIIGDRVRLYQGVTLGAKSFPLDEQGNPIKGIDRHPIVEDDVIIYSNATILGRVTIGRGSTVGGNVWITRSVPPGSAITQMQPRQDRFEAGAGI